MVVLVFTVPSMSSEKWASVDIRVKVAAAEDVIWDAAESTCAGARGDRIVHC